MNIAFTPDAWKEFLDWSAKDKVIFKKINALIADIQRNGVLNGIGKPEVLKYREETEYSRRITQEHRLVYVTDEKKNLIIKSCQGHYED